VRWLLICVAACAASPPVPVPVPVHEPPAVAHAPPDAEAPPDAGPVCDPYDEHDPACRNDPRACLHGLADCTCPVPPDVDNPACWVTMPCPAVPDRRVLACRGAWPACPDGHPDPANPRCPDPTVMARVIRIETDASGATLVTISAGADQGLDRSWPATLLRGDSDDALPRGEVTLLRIGKREAIGKVQVPADVVNANGRVRFRRP
jgi:hypothetical protein